MSDPGDRRLRIGNLRDKHAHCIGQQLTSVGAKEVTYAPYRASERLTLEARLPADAPSFLEDRLATWLHVWDPYAEATLETARGDGPWLEGWRAIYDGFVVGGFHIRPPWKDPLPGKKPIVIDPRGAFGSGGHPTTRLLLRALEYALIGRAGQRALDIGAGSGVLSVAAARMGLEVIALEPDLIPRSSCQRAVFANDADVDVLDLPIEDVNDHFDAVIATDSQGALAKVVRDRLSPGGVVIVGGFHPEQRAAVEEAYALGAGHPFASEDGEWGAVVLTAPAVTPSAAGSGSS